MIADTIEHAGRYFCAEGITKALQLLRGYTPVDFVPGKHEIDGERLFLIYTEYETEPAEQGLMEAHRKYADVMLMLEGEEALYFKPTGRLGHMTNEYDPEQDALLAAVDEDASRLVFRPGMFAVLLPEDAHCPGCQLSGPSHVKKIIAKVMLESKEEKQ